MVTTSFQATSFQATSSHATSVTVPGSLITARLHAPGSRRRLAPGLLALGLAMVPLLLLPRPAAAGMLDTVKQNPALARSLCEQFKQLNASGQSATSKESIARVAASQGLSTLDAEVLTTYVIGLHCPDVR
jgi:hypothetical protein